MICVYYLAAPVSKNPEVLGTVLMTACSTGSLQSLLAMSIFSSWELCLLRLDKQVFETLFFFYSKDCETVVTEQSPSSPVAKPGPSPEPLSKVRNDVLSALANLQTAYVRY